MLKLALACLTLTTCEEIITPLPPKNHTVTFSVNVSKPCRFSVLALANGLGGGADSEANWTRTDSATENAMGSISASIDASFDSSCYEGLVAQCKIAVDGVVRKQENAAIHMDGRWGTIRRFRCTAYYDSAN